MYWTLELASHLEDAPWPATKDELIDYAIRSGAPVEVIENLQALEDDGEPYEILKRYGLITLQKMTSFLTKTNINNHKTSKNLAASKVFLINSFLE
jgi:glycerate-2-kinase